jgi:uncharacterized repeat protein (TIGR01451 family)
VLVDDSDFLTVNSGIDGGTGITGVLNMTVQNSVVNQSEALPFGINFVTGASSTGRLKATGNTFIGCSGGAGQVPTNMCSLGIDLDASINSTLEAILLNNTISDTGLGGGIEFQVNDDAIGKVEVRDNIVNLAQANKQGMLFRARTVSPNNNDTGSIDVTLEGNTINNLTSSGGVAVGFEINAGTSGSAVTHANRTCVNLATQANGGGNPAAGGNIVNGVITAGLTYAFILRQRPGTTFQVQGYTGGGADVNAIQNFVKNNNSGGTIAGETLAGNVINYTNVPCAVPSTPTLPPVAAQIVSEPLAFSPPSDLSFSNISYTAAVEPLKNIQSLLKYSANAQTISTVKDIIDTESTVKIIETNEPTNANYFAYATRFIGNAVNTLGDFAGNVGSMVSPTVQAETKAEQLSPASGETITKSLGTIPAGESVVIKFKVTIDANILVNDFSVANTAQISAANHQTINSTTVTTTVVQPASIAKAFGAANIALNSTTTLTFTLANGNATSLTNVSFTDALPAGLVVADAPNVVNNCTNGTVTATAGANSISYSGGTRAAGSSCTIVVTVKGTTEGAKNNVTSVINSTEGGTGSTAAATLNVIAAASFAKAFGASTVQLNGSTTLTFTITNNSTVFPLNNISFTDNLPVGLIVSAPSVITGTCGGGGTVSANQSSSAISLSGAVLAANTNCSFSVNVTGTSVGVKNNSVSLSTAELGTGATATASITVVVPSTIAKAFTPTFIQSGGQSTVTLTLTNGNTIGALTNASFADVLINMTAVGGAAGGSCVGASSNVLSAGAANLSFSGITIPNNGNCTVTFAVTSGTPGTHPNTTSGVTSNQTPVAGTPSNTANLTVAVTYSISGQITNGGEGLSGVGVALSGGTNSSVTTDASGNYSFANLSGGVNYTLTPTLNGYTFIQPTITVNNLNANQTNQNFATSVVTYEGDVAARPTGDGAVDIFDLITVGNIIANQSNVAPLAAGGEFQRADAAPRASKGDGSVDVQDLIQMGLYAAVRDPLTPASGATSPIPPPPPGNSAESFDTSDSLCNLDGTNAPAAGSATVSAGNAPASMGAAVIPVQLNSTNVGGVQFTVTYDSTKLSIPSLASITDRASNVSFTFNNSTPGQLGVVAVQSTAGDAFPAQAMLFNINFTVVSGAASGTTSIGFGSTPVPIKASDPAAGAAPIGATPGSVTILGPTAAEVSVGGRALTQKGRGIMNVTISLTDSRGQTRTARTNPFGYYRFDHAAAGETYIITANGKKYTFVQPSQVLNVNEDALDINFIADPKRYLVKE